MAEKEVYYRLLGIRKKATSTEIKRAYAKLARKYHPDVNPENKGLEEKYRAVVAAYSVLSDPKKRREYDRVGHQAYLARAKAKEINLTGAEGVDESLSAEPPEGETDVLDQVLDSGIGEKHLPIRGEDLEQMLEVTFFEAVKGAAKTVNVEHEVPCPNCSKSNIINVLNDLCLRCGGKGYEKVTEKVGVRVPPGADEHRKIKVTGKGQPGRGGGVSGDLYVNLKVKPHKYFWRQGKDLFGELPLSYCEALLGARINVPTADGWVLLTVPPGVQNGQKLRLKGKGVRSERRKERGDQYAVVKIVVPRSLNPRERTLLEELRREHPYDPREGLDWELDRT